MSDPAPKSKPPKAENLSLFAGIAADSASGFQSLRALVGHIGQLADDYDRGALDGFFAVFTELFPDVAEEVNKAAEAGGNPKPVIETRSSALVKADRSTNAVEKKISGSDAAKLVAAAAEFKRKAPTQGRLVREGALTTLVSHFEAVLAQLVHAYYESYPSALPAESQSLALADLRLLSSIEDAEKFIVAKEVDAVLRESTQTQIEYFGKRLKLDLKAIGHLIPSVVEVSQRRNTYVHNRGIANKQYLASISPELVTALEIKEGQKLGLPTKYLLASIDAVEVVATVLVQLSWRKWGSPDGADDRLNSHIYDALQDRRTSHAKELAVFCNGR